MKNLKTKWLLGAIMGALLLWGWAAPVSAELSTFLVKSIDGSYYEYNSADLNNSYLSTQINPGGAGGNMYLHFNSLLKASGKVIGLGDTVKGYMDYPGTALALLKHQMWGIKFDINAYFASDEGVKLTEQVYNVKVVDKNGNVSGEPGGGETPVTGEISYKEPSSSHIVVDQATATHYVNNQVLLTANEGVAKNQIVQLVSGTQGTVVGYIEITNDFQIEYPASKSKGELDAIVAQLKNSSLVADASVHYLYEAEETAIPNDTKWASEEWSSSFPEQTNWGVEAINAMGAWEHFNQMQYVKVGVIDSMFDTHHEDLNYTEVWNNPSSITDQHGTHVSGTIAAAYNNNKGIAGVAPKVNLYGYALEGTEDQASLQFKGEMEFKYAAAKLISTGCKVINLSYTWGLPENASLNMASMDNFLKKLLDKNYDFVLVQSAGNSSSNDVRTRVFSGTTNADVRNHIIIVGAIGNNGSHRDGFFGFGGDRLFDGYNYADFSNYGQWVDVVAPGVGIYSTIPGSNYEGGWDGTSMAAPHVTGVAAMLYSVNPGLSGDQVKDIVVNTANTAVTDNNANHEVRNYNLVNADAAVDLAITTVGEVETPVGRNTGVVMSNVQGYPIQSPAIELTPVVLDNVKITAYKTNASNGNLGEYVASTENDFDGNYQLILDEGQYYINIFKEGYLPMTYSNVNVVAGEVNYLENAILTYNPDGVRQAASIKGTVRDALTGNTVADVTIKLRKGWDKKTGEYVKDIYGNVGDYAVNSNTSGFYQLEALEGSYTAELTKNGYVTGYLNLVCGQMDINQDAVITPVLSANQYRVVLTWGENPLDVDSHLTGPLADGSRFHVFYNSKIAYDGGEKVAELDLDDRYSYGPETITTTLTQNQNGVYRYSVQDYTNRGNNPSSALSLSGAQVKLYNGNELINTFNVPVNQGGTLWNVFELENGTLRKINTMEYVSDPWAVD